MISTVFKAFGNGKVDVIGKLLLTRPLMYFPSKWSSFAVPYRLLLESVCHEANFSGKEIEDIIKCGTANCSMGAEETSSSVSLWVRRSGEGLKRIPSVAYHTGSQFPKMLTYLFSKFKHNRGTFQSSIFYVTQPGDLWNNKKLVWRQRHWTGHGDWSLRLLQHLSRLWKHWGAGAVV